MKPGDLPVRHQFADLPGLRMHFVEVGEGPLVLLLHGFPETWWSWRYQLEPLAKAGFRVVAPDLRGYGQTQTHGPYDLDTLTADVCHLIDHLGASRAVIIGHDWGGGVAWHLSAKRPEYCEQLVVLNCPHLAIMRRALIARPTWAQLKKSWYFFFFLVPGVPEWLLTRNDAGNIVRTLKSSVVDRTHFGPDEIRPFRDAIQRPGAAKAMVGWYRDIVFDALRNPLTPPVYDETLAPTLLLWGMNDPALGYADVVPGTERYVPNLQIVQVQNAGHFVHAERPEVVNAAIIRVLNGRKP